MPKAAQDGNPTRDEARWQGIYIHTPAFTITTIAGQDHQTGPEVRFSRVVEAPAGPAGPGQRQPPMPEPDFGERFDDSTTRLSSPKSQSNRRRLAASPYPTAGGDQGRE